MKTETKVAVYRKDGTEESYDGEVTAEIIDTHVVVTVRKREECTIEDIIWLHPLSDVARFSVKTSPRSPK